MLVRALVVLGLLLSTAAHADRFDVQIGAFTNPDVSKIVLPANVGELRSISGPDGLTRFVVGPFASRTEAEQARDRLRGTGFGGAFVRASEDLRTVVQESTYESGTRVVEANYTNTANNVSDSDTEGEVVYLDGQLHRKVGGQFIPIRD